MSRTGFWTMALFAACTLIPIQGQQGTPATGEWRVNGGDSGSTRYSPLDQINADERQKPASGLAVEGAEHGARPRRRRGK